MRRFKYTAENIKLKLDEIRKICIRRSKNDSIVKLFGKLAAAKEIVF